MGLDPGEHLSVEAWNGSQWEVLFRFTDGQGDDDRWHAERVDLFQFLQVSDFRLRLSARMSRTNERVQVDDIVLIAE